MATHSTEIIYEVSPGSILSIESSLRNARRITSEDGYRHVFQYLGSSENVEFARLARARRIVFFEGDDRRLLRRFANKVGRARILNDPDTVFLKTGGFGQWKRVNEVGWTFENVLLLQVKIVAIFDSDYRCCEEVDAFRDSINSNDIMCHILGRKEIENYALARGAIIRTLMKRGKEVQQDLREIDCAAMIEGVLNELHNVVRSNIVGQYTQHHRETHRNLSETTLAAQAIATFEAGWRNMDQRLEIVGGKDFISTLSRRLHELIGRSITIAQIVQEMNANEIPQDLINMIDSIEVFFA